MIGKITKGSNFTNVFASVLNQSTKFTILPEAQQCFSNTPKDLACEFQYVANFRHRTTYPVRHYSISFAPKDGTIHNKIKAEITVRIMTEMGFGDSQYLGVAHSRDNPNHHQVHDRDHIHIIANSIKPNGERVSDFWDYRRMEQCLRKIEIDYGLQQLTNSWERHKNNNIIQPIELQEKIDKALSDSPCLSEWIDRLELSEVNLKFRITSQGHVQGISYIYQSKLNKGSDIDRGWRFICSKFDKIPQNLESMRLANLKTQSLSIELRQEDDELMAKTANLAMQKLNGLNRFKDKSVIVSLIDGVLKIQRLRPNKIVLSAQKNLAGEWKSLGIPNIDPEKDLRILET